MVNKIITLLKEAGVKFNPEDVYEKEIDGHKAIKVPLLKKASLDQPQAAALLPDVKEIGINEYCITFIMQ